MKRRRWIKVSSVVLASLIIGGMAAYAAIATYLKSSRQPSFVKHF